MDLLIQTAGFTAAAVSVLTFIPQALKIWKLRHDAVALEGVSRMTLWCLGVAQACWLIYGFGVGALWTALPSLIILPMVIFMLAVLNHAHRPSKTEF